MAELAALEEEARVAKRGRYTDDATAVAGAIRDVKFQGSYNAEELFGRIKDKPQTGEQAGVVL